MGNMISESDTRANFINPKLVDSQWEPIHIVREYYFTDGRELLGNKREKRLFLDYLLKSTTKPFREVHSVSNYETECVILPSLFNLFYTGKFLLL